MPQAYDGGKKPIKRKKKKEEEPVGPTATQVEQAHQPPSGPLPQEDFEAPKLLTDVAPGMAATPEEADLVSNAWLHYDSYQELKTTPVSAVSELHPITEGYIPEQPTGPEALEQAKANWLRAREQLLTFRRAQKVAAVEASSALVRLVQKVPRQFLEEAPYSSIYLAAADKNHPGIIDGVAEALPWLQMLYGRYLSVKAASTQTNNKNRTEFDTWARNAAGHGVFVAARGIQGVATGQTAEELEEQLATATQGDFPSLTWHVDEQWATDHPTQFAFIFSEALKKFPSLQVSFTPATTPESVAFAEFERQRREEEDQGVFGTILTGLGVGLDTAASPISFAVRYGSEFLREGKEVLSGTPEIGDEPGFSVPSPVEVYRDVVPPTIRHLPELISGEASVEQINRWIEEEEDEAGLRLGQQVAQLAGWDPSMPEYRSATLVASFVADIWIGKIAGGFAKGRRLAARQPFAFEEVVEHGKWGAPKIVRRPVIPVKFTPAGNPISTITNPWTRRAIERLALTPEEFFVTGKGSQVVNQVFDMVQAAQAAGRTADDIAVDILTRLGRNKMTPEDARLLARVSDPSEVTEILTAGMRGGGRTVFDVRGAKSRLEEIRTLLDDGAEEATDLLAEKEFLDLRVARVRKPAVIQEYPSFSFVNDAVRGFETTRPARMFRFLTQDFPLTKPVGALWRQLPDARLASPFHPAAPLDAVERGFETLDRFMGVLGIPNATRTGVLGKWLGMRNSTDLFDVMESIGEAIYLAPNVDPIMAKELATLFDSAGADLIRGLLGKQIPGRQGLFQVDTLSETRRVVDDMGNVTFETRSLPAWPTELIQFINLPSHRDIADATKIIRGFLRKYTPNKSRNLIPFLKGQSIAGKTVAMAALPTKYAMHMVDALTFVWKRAVLMAKFPLSLPMRIQSEQMFRMAAYDFKSLVNHPRQWLHAVRGEGEFAQFSDDVDAFLGSIVRDSTEEYRTMYGGGGDIRNVYRYTDPNKAPYFRAWADKILQRSQDPIGRHLARFGPDDTVNWLESGSGAMFRKMMEPVMERAGVTLGQYVDNLWEELQFLTKGNKDVLRAIHTGSFVRRALVEGEIPELGFRASLRTSVREAKDIRRGIAAGDVPDDPKTRGKLLALDNEISAARTGRQAELDISDVGSMGEVLEGEVVGGRLQPVEFVSGSVFNADMDAAKILSGAGRGVRDVVDAAFRRFYTDPDLMFSRRPLFRQVAEREYNRLRALGMSRTRARDAAVRTSAHKAADMLYDLGARSSGQFYLRNVAPFFPAWQEMMETWLIRIPQQFGSAGLGHAVLAARGKDMVNMMELTGVIQRDADGKLVVPAFTVGIILTLLGGGITAAGMRGAGIVTGIGGVAATTAATLAKQHNIELNIPLESLNMVTAGIFGLGPLPAVVVGQLAQDHKGVFEAIADFFMPFGTEVSVFPTSVNRLWAAMDGSPFPLEFASKDYQKVLWDWSVEDGLVQARMELGPSPAPSDELVTLLAKQTTDLTPEQKDAVALYRTGVSDYFEQIMSAARGYAKTYYLMKGLSGMLLPGMVQITPEWKEEKNAFWEEFDRVKDAGGDTAALFTEFLNQHPNGSWMLTPKSFVRPGEERPPFIEDEDDSFQQYLTSIREERLGTLTPEQFLMYSFAAESYRQLQRRREQVQQSFGTPQEYLLNLNQAWSMGAEYEDDFDVLQRMNEEAFALWNRIREDAALGKGDVPVRTLAQERLMEFRSLGRELAPFFVDEVGAQDTDYRAVLGRISDILGPQEFGTPNTEFEQNVGWWWENVGRPYFDGRGEIIDRALASDTPGPIWDELRRLANGQKKLVGPDGQKWPTPEEVVWGMMNPDQQQLRLLTLSTKRLEWLTEFERHKLGWEVEDKKVDKQVSKFFDTYNNEYAALQQTIADRNLHPQSSEATDLTENFENRMLAYSRKQDKKVQHLYAWMEQPMFERVDAQGTIEGESWSEVAQQARRLGAEIAAEGYSVSGGSGFALPRYDELTRSVTKLRKQDDEFDRQMTQLEVALGAVGSKMYQAVFFGRTYGL